MSGVLHMVWSVKGGKGNGGKSRLGYSNGVVVGRMKVRTDTGWTRGVSSVPFEKFYFSREGMSFGNDTEVYRESYFSS